MYSGYWVIGILAEIGELLGYIYCINDFYGLTDDENEWYYWDGSSWIYNIHYTDIKITCVNDN